MKMEGLGNDFVVVDGPIQPGPSDIEAWCERRRGVGADGVLAVTPLGDGRVRMDYWNADGSPAEMCGNGLRCVARYAYDRGWAPGPDFVIDTAAGDRPVQVREDESVRAFLGVPEDPGVEPFEVAGYQISPLVLGNPHAVIFVDDCRRVPVEAIGPLVEGDSRFADRANVEFVTVGDPLDVRVWERGVGETLACGTGAAAAAVMAHRRGLSGTKVTVQLPGGPLGVELDDAGVWIEGPARYVFRGRLP